MKLAFYIAAKGGAQDKAIAAYTHGPYSHVEFVIDETFAPSIPPALIHPHDAGGSLCYTSSPMKPRDGCGFEVINLADGKWRTFDLPSMLDWKPAVKLALADNGPPVRLARYRGFRDKGTGRPKTGAVLQRGVRVAAADGGDATGTQGGDGITELPRAGARAAMRCPACGVKGGGYKWVPPPLFGEELTGYHERIEGSYECTVCGEVSAVEDWEPTNQSAAAAFPTRELPPREKKLEQEQKEPRLRHCPPPEPA